MLLSGQTLIDTLHEHLKKANYRIWIASPFIGSLAEFNQILGGNWMRANINFRILSDTDAGFIRKDTFDEIQKTINSEIRSLLSLHAKIYIVDDWCLLSSANLTGTAFSRRYEVGYEYPNIKEVETLFLQLWNIASPVSKIHFKQDALVNYQDGKAFSKKWKLPKYLTNKTDKFLVKCDKFIEFAKLYEETTGRNQQMVADGFTLFQEIDYFFNYLYHDDPKQPSQKYKHQAARKLTNEQTQAEILKYFKNMPYDKVSEAFRLQRTALIQNLLSPKHIHLLTIDEVKVILSCFHCLSSYPINRTRIPNNNTLTVIKQAWNILLNTGDIDSSKIESVKSSIKYFGDSCVSELIAWYLPDKYPMMNLNSESGMRFMGIDV